jgi:deoxyribonuclease-4
MRLGVHVSAAGMIYQAFERAAELGCNTMQIFARSPQQWRQARLDPAEVKEFALRKETLDINPIFIHIPYLINLASPVPGLYKASLKAYIEDIMEAEALKADYIVTHMGSHKDTSEESGIRRITRALNLIIQRTKKSRVGILLENTSGSGSWLGYKFSHHREIIRGLEDKQRVGLCLDTAHAFLAGYDISSRAGLEALLDEIGSLVGLEKLKLVHFNDARGKLGSHFDRHDHIGKGSIGMEGMKRIINHPLLRGCAFILETPKDEPQADRKNLEITRKFLGK